ncbi:Glu-tRNA(Gln) amidotransferase subunit GatE [bacterium]|nr:Glu-tRNA(Gln) amidotransferase subunit GatE [bacterium]
MNTTPDPDNFNPRKEGFRCGLEIHQQILTEKKLFCHCPAGIYSEDYDAQVLRHMRPTLSELGEYDGTALMEFKTHKEIIYRINKKLTCTYEMDDNPPFLINQQAVDIAIEIALLLKCSIVGELHVIRKQYLDGSIPAGFQRTAIIGVNGWIPYKDKKISIIQLALEEDACREISDVGHRRIYATDRLAMPLIEVVTGPDMLDPQEAYEVGVQLGRLLRTTGKIRRGIGSVRQDVNVSVNGGTRIEIKGVPQLPLIPDLVFYEAFRQYSLLNLRDKLAERGINKENLQTARFDLSGKLENSALADLPDDENKVSALLIKEMSGLFAHRLGSNRNFADDVRGRIRVIACLEHYPFMLHTDDQSETTISGTDKDILKSVTGMTDNDLVVVVWGPPGDVETALNEVEIRVREAIEIIPNETRQRQPSGETDFERILPGADRMYPDTDSPPLPISRERVDKIRGQMPVLPWVKEAEYKELDLPNHLAWMLAISSRRTIFDRLVSDNKVEPVLAAVVLLEQLKNFSRLGGNLDIISDDCLDELFSAYKKGAFVKEGFRMLIEECALTGNTDWVNLAEKLNIRRVKKEEINKIISESIDTAREELFCKPENLPKVVIGIVMDKLRGSVSGKELIELIQHELNE